MINRSCTELSIKLFGSQTPKIVNGKRPEMKHVVSGESVPLLHNNDFGSQKGEFDGSPQTTGATTNNQTLSGEGGEGRRRLFRG